MFQRPINEVFSLFEYQFPFPVVKNAWLPYWNSHSNLWKMPGCSPALPQGITRIINKLTCHHSSRCLTRDRGSIIIFPKSVHRKKKFMHAGPGLLCLISSCCLLNSQLLPNGTGSERWLFPFSIFHDSRIPTNYHWPQLDRWSRTNLRPQKYYPRLINNCANPFDAKGNCGLLVGAMVAPEMS